MNIPLAQYRDLLGVYLRPHRGRVILLTVLLFAGIGLELLNPQVVRYFIDTTQAHGLQAELFLVALAFIAIGLLQRVIALSAFHISENLGWTATNALRRDLAGHLLQLDLSFHKRRTPGELIQRVEGDVTALARFFSQMAILLVGNGLLIVIVLLLLYREDWRAGLVLTLYAVVTFLLLGGLQNLGVDRWAATRQTTAELFGFVEERIAGTEDIRANGAEAYVMRGLYARLRESVRRELAARMMGAVSYVATNFVFATGYALGLAVGAYLYSQGDITIGAAFVVVYYIGLLAAPIENIRREVRDLQEVSADIQRVREYLRIQPRVRDAVQAGAENTPTLPGGPLSTAFDRVSFRYEDDAPLDEALSTKEYTAELSSAFALRDVSFQLQPGHILGLLGRTGSGKTTLTRLIFRLYDPTGGSIRLGGTDIREVPLVELRHHVAMVTQEVQLFEASIRDNLVFFNCHIDDREIERALRELGLWEWAQSLPEGLNTRLGARGLGLSAGEAQLLAFTRVFLRDPGLVILDEASSRLDPATEHLLEQAIERLLRGRTGIVIAHRLQTVRRADEIMILEHGQIAEFGPRAILAGEPHSRFYSLLRTGLEEALA